MMNLLNLFNPVRLKWAISCPIFISQKWLSEAKLKARSKVSRQNVSNFYFCHLRINNKPVIIFYVGVKNKILIFQNFRKFSFSRKKNRLLSAILDMLEMQFFDPVSCRKNTACCLSEALTLCGSFLKWQDWNKWITIEPKF